MNEMLSEDHKGKQLQELRLPVLKGILQELGHEFRPLEYLSMFDGFQARHVQLKDELDGPGGKEQDK